MTVLFSYLNYATNGFELAVTTSIYPNVTMSKRNALRGLPALLTGKYKPNCPPVSLPTNSQFFTNSTGLQYKILKVTEDQGQVILPALTYSNNILEDCEVTLVDLSISSHDRTAAQYVLQGFGIVVNTYATCNITTNGGKCFFEPGRDAISRSATRNNHFRCREQLRSS